MRRGPREQASRIGIAPKTLDNWRSEDEGPPYYKVGGRVLYDDDEVDVWLATRRVDPAAKKARVA